MGQSNAGYRNNKYNTGGDFRTKGKLAEGEDEIDMSLAATPPLQDTDKLASKNAQIVTSKGGGVS